MTSNEYTGSVGGMTRPGVTYRFGTDGAMGCTHLRNGAMGTLWINGQMLRERRTYDGLRLQLTGIALERCLDNSVACGTVGYVDVTAGAESGGGDGGFWLRRGWEGGGGLAGLFADPPREGRAARPGGEICVTVPLTPRRGEGKGDR